MFGLRFGYAITWVRIWDPGRVSLKVQDSNIQVETIIKSRPKTRIDWLRHNKVVDL